MQFSLLDFFTHPVLAASTFATILLSIFCALFGCILFVRRKALLAETLSHAAYLGVVIGLLFSGFDLLIGAFTALLGVLFLRILEKHFRLSTDVALTVTLAVSLSFGTLLASITQLYAPMVYKQSLIFLYGQAATMLTVHVYYFSLISGFAILFLLLCYRVLAWSSFDPLFFRAQSIQFKGTEALFYILLSLAVVIGARASGIMLVSGMMIAPAIIARSFTDRFFTMLWIASLSGAGAAFIGMVLSVYMVMPTGPLIIVTLAFFTVVALVFSPKEGYFSRIVRGAKFLVKIQIENALKDLFKGKKISWAMQFVLICLGLQKRRKLTEKGEGRAQNLIRVHRLWEVYVSEKLGVQGRRIHESAEEMEHVLDEEMERQLTKLLNDPRFDPHNNEIPRRRT